MAVSEHSDSRSPVRPQLHCGLMPLGSGDALIRNQHVAQFSAESIFALHHVAFEDDAAAVAGADDAGDRSLAAVGAEDGVVSPERRRVGVIQIGDGFAELAGQALADIESGPVGMDKVGGASRAELARGAGGTGVSRPTATTSSRRRPLFRRRVSGRLRSAAGRCRVPAWQSGMLEQALDEKFFLLIQQCVVDGGSAQIDSGHDLHSSLLGLDTASPQLSRSRCNGWSRPHRALRILRLKIFTAKVAKKFRKGRKGAWGGLRFSGGAYECAAGFRGVWSAGGVDKIWSSCSDRANSCRRTSDFSCLLTFTGLSFRFFTNIKIVASAIDRPMNKMLVIWSASLYCRRFHSKPTSQK